MALTDRQKRILDACRKIPLGTIELGNEYYYNSLVFCLIDSIFSIGVRYTSTKNTVLFYSKYRQCENKIYYDTEPEDELTINDLITDIEHYDDHGMKCLFNNRQKTSSRGGIRKAEAVYIAAKLLLRNGINTIKDIKKCENGYLEKQFKQIPGQSSGISYSYLLMLVGYDDHIKVDRWIKRFVEDATGERVNENSIEEDLLKICQEIKKSFPKMTPRLLDYAIWSNTRGKRICSH